VLTWRSHVAIGVPFLKHDPSLAASRRLPQPVNLSQLLINGDRVIVNKAVKALPKHVALRQKIAEEAGIV